MTDAPAEIEGLTSKAAWWAGARAGLGLPPDTPREVVAQRLAATRAALSEQPAIDMDELRRAVCLIGTVGTIGGHDVIRRNSALEIIDARIDRANS